MDITHLREQIPVCQRMVYMNTGWSGPSPLSAVEAIRRHLDYEMEEGPTNPEVLESGREIQVKARDAVARLIKASPEEVLPTQNTTEGLNIVINGLQWHEGDEIITCDLEHNSVLTTSYFHQLRHGVVVKVLPIATDEPWEIILDKIEGAITQRTKVVFFSHIQYSCGLRMPVKEIASLTRGRGIRMLLDGAQAAGHIEVDVQDIGCDFYSLPGQKWLLGPDGTGALYIRKDRVPELEPLQVSGRAARPSDDPYGFEPDISSIDKFLLTSSSAALRAGMLECMRFIEAIGVGEIERRNLDLAAYLGRALREVPGVSVLSPTERSSSSGLVSFTIDGVDPKRAAANLWEEHHIVARSVGYPPCMRASLHFFNTEEEVDTLVGAVRSLA